MSRRKVFAALMLVVGILFFAIPIVYDYRGSKETDKLTQEFEQILEEKQEDETETEESKEEETEAAVSEEDAAIFAEGDVIAILEIESLEIRYPVVEGCSSSDLNKAIGHMSETAMVGSAGNCVLCGHNGSRYGEFFTKLNQIELGDMVTLLDTSGELHFQVFFHTLSISQSNPSPPQTDSATGQNHSQGLYIPDSAEVLIDIRWDFWYNLFVK